MSSSSSSLTSPSAPPPSTQFVPFDRLPFELVEDILRYTVPSYYHSETYEERRHILLSLSLVSRLFHRIARPLLYAVAVFHYPEYLKQWQQAQQGEEKAGDPLGRELVLFPSFSFERIQVDLQPLFDRQSSLTTLALVDIEPEIDLAQLVQLRNLSSLRLARLTISASRFFILPRLRDLSLVEVLPEKSCFSNVRQQSFPSLRAFASLEGHRTSPPSPLLQLLSTDLFPQLDAIQLDEASVSNFPTDFLDSIKHKLLFEYNGVFLDDGVRRYNPPEYVRFARCNRAYFEFIWSEIHDWPENSIPSLIYFGLSFKPHGRTRTELERQLDYRSSLYDSCKRRKMEVVYEERGEDGEDHVISQDFWRRMRIKKLGKTQGVEEEE